MGVARLLADLRELFARASSAHGRSSSAIRWRRIAAVASGAVGEELAEVGEQPHRGMIRLRLRPGQPTGGRPGQVRPGTASAVRDGEHGPPVIGLEPSNPRPLSPGVTT
jgi:hypothetical protein